MQLIKTVYTNFGSKTLVYKRGLGYWRESLKDRYNLSAPFIRRLVVHRAVLHDLSMRHIMSALCSVVNVFGPFRSNDPTFTPVNRKPTWSLKNLYSFIFNSLTTNTYSGSRLNVSPLYPQGNVAGSEQNWRASIAAVLLAKIFVACKYVNLTEGPSDNVIYILRNNDLIPTFFSERAEDDSLLTIVGTQAVKDALTAYFESLQGYSADGGSLVIDDAASRIATELSRLYLQISRAISQLQMSMSSVYRVLSTISNESDEALLPHHVSTATKWFEYFNSFVNLNHFAPSSAEAPSEGDYRITDDFFVQFQRAIESNDSEFEIVQTTSYFTGAFTISEVPNLVLNHQQKGYIIEWASPKALEANIDELHLNNENGALSGFVEVKDDLSSSLNWASSVLSDLTTELRSNMTNSTFMAENMAEGYLDLTDHRILNPYGDQGSLIKQALAVSLAVNVSFNGLTWIYETHNIIKSLYTVSHFASVDFRTEDPGQVICVNAPSFVHEGLSLYKHPNVNGLIDKKWLRVANITQVTDNAIQLTTSFSEQLEENQSYSIPTCDVTLHSPSDYDYSVQLSRFVLLCHDKALSTQYGLYLVTGLNTELINTTVQYMLRLINVSTNVSESAYAGLRIYKKIRNIALTYFGQKATTLTVGLTSPINQSIISYTVGELNFSLGLQYNIAHNSIMMLLRGLEELGLNFVDSLRTLITNTERRFETTILMEG